MENKKSLTDLVLAELEPTAKRISALNILESGKVPASAVQKRKSRGGELSYIDHVWTVSVLRDAFGHLWSFDIGDTRLFEFVPLLNKKTGELIFEYPKFASATCTLSVAVGGYKTSISETGAFDNTRKLNPVAAEASAVHRALVKCAMLMFGLGVEFYKGYKPHAASVADLWASLLEYGTGQGLAEGQIVEAIKKAGITKDTLVDRFDEARNAVSLAIDEDLVLDQFKPQIEDAKKRWAMPTKGPGLTDEIIDPLCKSDPVVEAAIELGGKVVDEGVPDFTGLGRKDTDPTIKDLAVNQETGEILEESKETAIDWVKFYEWTKQNWNDEFGRFTAQDARNITLDIFGCKATELTPFGKKAIAAAFLEWMKSTDNESREVIRKKYRE